MPTLSCFLPDIHKIHNRVWWAKVFIFYKCALFSSISYTWHLFQIVTLTNTSQRIWCVAFGFCFICELPESQTPWHWSCVCSPFHFHHHGSEWCQYALNDSLHLLICSLVAHQSILLTAFRIMALNTGVKTQWTPI